MLMLDPVKGGQALLLIANVMDQRAPGGWHVVKRKKKNIAQLHLQLP